MPSLFSAAEREWLRRPHISRVWFSRIELPSGTIYMHGGVGRVTLDGQEWRGITDPGGHQLVSIGTVEEPRFGQAAKLDIVISGIDVNFLRSIKDTARQIEGVPADALFCLFDQETAQPWPSGMKLVIPGKLSAPRLRWAAPGERIAAFSIEGPFQSQNYPFGGKWNPADQRRRFPGDKGLDFVGVKVQEIIKA
jgi:hypothetical protein